MGGIYLKMTAAKLRFYSQTFIFAATDLIHNQIITFKKKANLLYYKNNGQPYRSPIIKMLF